jgi:hypothetical protein
VAVQGYVKRALTLKVRHALELIGREDDASDAINALSARGLVVIEREKLLSEEWLLDRVETLRCAGEILSYDSQHPESR